MGNLLTLRPRAPRAPEPSPAEIRTALEHALEVTLDAADVLVAQLDAMDGDPDREPGGDDEPSLAAPIGGGSQVPWAAGNSHDLEQALARLGRGCLTLPRRNEAP